MIFTPTPLAGCFIIDVERRGDERGFFGRAWCKEEFEAHGLKANLAQANVSFSAMKGTLRGMHFQKTPHEETKVVRCTKGAVYDVAIDLRPDSPTHRQWVGVELTEENRRMLFVPERFAHGFITLTDDAEVFYLVTAAYAPGHEGGLRHDDPAFGIDWPGEVTVMSDKDRAWPLYDEVGPFFSV
ncbi:MAG: dTDP-4-dehydrorhamnose 3,5-epimerase [Bacteroidota bacterium]